MSFHSRQMLVTLAFAAALWPSSALSEPQAVFSPTEHHFGGVRRGEKVARTFQLRNGGDASLELTGVRFSMPGMTAPLAGTGGPGADATIELELTTDHVHGSVRGVAVVETNDPRARSVALVLTGMVHGPVDIEPLPAVFLSSFRGEDVRRELTVRSNQPGPVAIRLGARRGTHYEAELETVEPGRTWRLTVKPAAGISPGRYDETLELGSTHAATPMTPLPPLPPSECEHTAHPAAPIPPARLVAISTALASTPAHLSSRI